MSLIPIGLGNSITLYGNDGLQAVDSETIGNLLYPQSNIPEKLINRIFNRNKDYFTDADTTLLSIEISYMWKQDGRNIGSQIDSPCPNGDSENISQSNSKTTHSIQKRDLRFFTIPYGVMKICKFSRSPKAIDVIEKLFALQEAYLKGALPKPDPSIEYIAQMPESARGRGATIKEYAQSKGIAFITARRRVNRYMRGEPITGKNGNKGMQFLQKNQAHKFQKVIYFYEQGMKQCHIAKKLNMCHPTVSRWIRKYDHGFRPQISLKANSIHEPILNDTKGAVNG